MLINKKQDMSPYDMQQLPCRQNVFLLPLLWAVSYVSTRASNLKIKKIGMEGLKPPYLVLSQHQGFSDYYISPLTVFPHRANYVSDVEGFAAFGKFLYRQTGCIAKRRFVADIFLIKNIRHVVEKQKDIIMIYPEARHSNIGTNSKLPLSTGKLVKLLKIPVVVLKINGSYLTTPIWDEAHKRKVPISATLQKVFDATETRQLSISDIMKELNLQFHYDEYQWQYDNKIQITYKKRAEGLHKVLYQCPHCKEEYHMISHEKSLSCENCHKSWYMDEYGKLNATTGMTEFSHIPDWYEFQRKEVEKQIVNQRYELKTKVTIEALPNEKGFVSLGEGELEHTPEGFFLTIMKSAEKLYFASGVMNSVQTEYDYRNKGACVVLSTKDCCYYLYLQSKECNVTKMQFATEFFYEEIHFANKDFANKK